MEKLIGKTQDIVSDNISKLREIFPEAFKEGKIDFDVLKKVLGESVDGEKERYSFSWHGKSDAIKMALKQSTGTLRPQKAESKDWDTTKNLFLEGDNLEVLRILQSSYRGKVKMIYIDPPYNTGKDFVYADNFTDNIKNYKEKVGETMKANADSSGRYHTNWLNMMYPRLRLAKNLLTDNGVIFISIDDNEVANLRKICDEIFGEDNFAGQFVVNSTPNARDYGHIGKMHEYVLFYVKDVMKGETSLLPEKEKTFKYKDDISGFNIHPLYNSNVAFTPENRPNLFYPFYLNPKSGDSKGFFQISLDKHDGFVEIYPSVSKKDGVQFVWRWGKDKSREYLNKEIIGYQNGDGGFRIVQKMRHSAKVIRSLLLEKSVSSRRGTAEVEGLFNKKIFSFPKPIKLIKDFVNIATKNDDVVLDFFAGSSATAHAIMKLNADDRGNRKFIMVQIPESTPEDSEARKAGYKTIADIGKERIRRAGEKIMQEKKDKEGGLFDGDAEKLDIGFKVFTLDETNFVEWDENTKDVEGELLKSLESIKPDRSQEDALYEVLLKYGIDLTTPIEELDILGKKVYSLANNYLLVCLEKELSLDVIKQIAILKPNRVVFYDDGFADDNIKANAEQTLKQNGVEDIRVI